MEQDKIIDKYVFDNLKRLYIIENIYIPLFNVLRLWKPLDLNEFKILLNKITELKIGINSVEFYNETFQKYKPYNLEISKMNLKNFIEYEKITDRINKLNELYPEKITHITMDFEIPYPILLIYQKTTNKNQPQIDHDEGFENNLITKIKFEDQTALKELINLYKNEILYISKKYIDYNINPIHEGIYAFYNICRVYNTENHGGFQLYVIKWISSFIKQSAQESLIINKKK